MVTWPFHLFWVTDKTEHSGMGHVVKQSCSPSGGWEEEREAEREREREEMKRPCS
jgi:hypothetical protein